MMHLYINENKIKEVGYEISQNLKVTLFIPKVKQNIAKVKREMAQKPRLFFLKNGVSLHSLLFSSQTFRISLQKFLIISQKYPYSNFLQVSR